MFKKVSFQFRDRKTTVFLYKYQKEDTIFDVFLRPATIGDILGVSYQKLQPLTKIGRDIAAIKDATQNYSKVYRLRDIYIPLSCDKGMWKDGVCKKSKDLRSLLCDLTRTITQILADHDDPNFKHLRVDKALYNDEDYAVKLLDSDQANIVRFECKYLYNPASTKMMTTTLDLAETHKKNNVPNVSEVISIVKRLVKQRDAVQPQIQKEAVAPPSVVQVQSEPPATALSTQNESRDSDSLFKAIQGMFDKVVLEIDTKSLFKAVQGRVTNVVLEIETEKKKLAAEKDEWLQYAKTRKREIDNELAEYRDGVRASIDKEVSAYRALSIAAVDEYCGLLHGLLEPQRKRQCIE